jgi:hypothetical protein
MVNLTQSLGKLDNCLKNSLKVLDDSNVYISLVFILFLYNTCLFNNINTYVSTLYDYSVIRVVVLLLIIYISRKSTCLAILLAISYVISLYYNSLNENFEIMNMNNTNDNMEMKSEMMDQEEIMDQEEMMDQDNMNSNDSVENFMSLPGLNENDDNKNMNMNMNSNLNKNDCLNNYSPKNMEINDVCDSVATYQGEMNAQGLNYPVGFDKNNDQYLV